MIDPYAYHILTLGTKPLLRGSGDQHLHRTSDQYRAANRTKLSAYHVHVQLGCIAQGLQPNLSINHTPEVWRCLRSSLRTMNPVMPPSDLIVAFAPRSTLPEFLSVPALAADLTKIMAKYRPHDPSHEIDQMVMAAG